MFWQPLPQDRFLQKSKETGSYGDFLISLQNDKSGINAVSKVKCQYRKDALELWAIARAVISPSSFQTIKRNRHLLKKKKTKWNKKILNNPTSFQASCFSLLWFPKEDFTVSNKILCNTNNSLISGMKH